MPPLTRVRVCHALRAEELSAAVTQMSTITITQSKKFPALPLQVPSPIHPHQHQSITTATMGFEKEKKSVPRSERKAKKRKAEDAIPDVPEDYAEEQLDEQVKTKKRKADAEEPKKEKKSKKSKPEEKTEDFEMTEAAPAKEDKEEGSDGESQDPDAPRLSKKERKALRKAKEAAERLANPPVEGEALVEKSIAPKTDEKAEKPAKPEPRSAKPIPLDANGNPVKKKNNRNREKKRLAAAALAASGEKAPPRFIVFVGNLPFNATKETVEKHFGSVHPKSVRYLTDKVTKKGKGAAFVEFEGYDHMKTALRTMHHTEFDAGDGREKRKINVELT